MKKALLGVVVLVLGFGAVTLVALEGGEVVVVATVAGDGTHRETRAWIAEEDDALWIESANPDRGFYRDIVAGSAVAIARPDGTRKYRAVAAPNPEGHLRIRRLLREKYGWADVWIGMLADTSSSIGIRLIELGED